MMHKPGTGLGGTQLAILNVLDSLIPKDQKKYNTEMKSSELIRCTLIVPVLRDQ